MVKSDYFGVIICIWWRKVQKFGIFTPQNAKHTANSYKDPENWEFPKNYTVYTFYEQNTLINWDIRCDFPKNLEIHKLSIQLTSNLTICGEKTPKNWNFPQNGKKNFQQYLQTYMWFYKGVKLNILATKQKTAVAQIYKINTIQISTIIAENTENLLNLASYTIEIIQFKIVRNSHLL